MTVNSCERGCGLVTKVSHSKSHPSASLRWPHDSLLVKRIWAAMIRATFPPVPWAVSGVCLHTFPPILMAWPKEILEEGPLQKWQSSHQLGFLNDSLEATGTILLGVLLKLTTNFYFSWQIIFCMLCITVCLLQLFHLSHFSFVTTYKLNFTVEMTMTLGDEVSD